MPTPDTGADANTTQSAFLDDFLLDLNDDDNADGEEAPPKLTARQQRVLEAEAASAGYKPKHEGPFQFTDDAPSSGAPHAANGSLPEILPHLHWLYRRRRYREALDRSLAALRAWSQQEAQLTADKKRDENETIETIDLALRCCGKLIHGGLASGEDHVGNRAGGQGSDGQRQVEADFEWLQGLVIGLKTNTLQAPALALAAATVTRGQFSQAECG